MRFLDLLCDSHLISGRRASDSITRYLRRVSQIIAKRDVTYLSDCASSEVSKASVGLDINFREIDCNLKVIAVRTRKGG